MWASSKAVGKSSHVIDYRDSIRTLSTSIVSSDLLVVVSLHLPNSFRTTFRFARTSQPSGTNAVGLCCSLTHPLSRLGFTFPFGRSNVVRSSFVLSVRFGFLRVLCVCRACNRCQNWQPHYTFSDRDMERGEGTFCPSLSWGFRSYNSLLFHSFHECLEVLNTHAIEGSGALYQFVISFGLVLLAIHVANER